MNLDALVATVEDDVLPGLAYSLGSKRGAAIREGAQLQHLPPRDEQHLQHPSAAGDSRGAERQRQQHAGPVDGAGSLHHHGTPAHAADLYLTGRHLACMFQRATVRVKGVITDDVSYYHRLVGTLMNLRPLNSLYSDGASQLGTGFS
jgi:hypothetical protein